MPSWQWLVLLWIVLWALQSVGVWFQMRSYSKLTNSLMHEYADGYIGTGYSPRRLSRGAVAIIVVSPDMIARRVVIMTGMTFLAKFKPLVELEGVPLDQLVAKIEVNRRTASLREALAKAIVQIEKARENRAANLMASEGAPLVLGAVS